MVIADGRGSEVEALSNVELIAKVLIHTGLRTLLYGGCLGISMLSTLTLFRPDTTLPASLAYPLLRRKTGTLHIVTPHCFLGFFVCLFVCF